MYTCDYPQQTKEVDKIQSELLKEFENGNLDGEAAILDLKNGDGNRMSQHKPLLTKSSNWLS